MNEMVKLLYLFGLVFLLIIISSAVLGKIYGINEGNVALINIHSQISIEDSFLSGSVGSDSIIDLLKKAEENPNVEAIILSINSPGGTVVASKEVAEYILGMNKTVAAWIRDIGASGSYLIASACDYIVSDELSLVGSIGATMSYLSFNGTLEKYGAKYNEISSGSLKDMGSPYKDLTPEEYSMLSGIINESFDYFFKFVIENRNLSNDSADQIMDGRLVLGKQAKELGLVDTLGSKNEIIKYLESINLTDIIVYNMNSASELDIFELLNYKASSAYPTYD